jgi:hypothetical protein
MTTHQTPYQILPENVKLSSKYHPENDTFDVTGKMEGSFPRFVETLEQRMNFSTIVYTRKDDVFGDATMGPNGTMEFSGQIYFVHHNKGIFLFNHDQHPLDHESCTQCMSSRS